MDRPLEIAFHNVQHSDALEAEIRQRFEKLEKLYDHLVGARISVEGLHKQHLTGNIYEVHIDLRVPGGELAVSREPHRAKDKYAHPDVYASVREAFGAAESQLKRYKELQRGEVKTHPPAFQGQVSQLYPREDHGFILTNEGAQLYFHRNSLINAELNALKRGDVVHYIATTGDTGPIASKVWAGPAEPMD